ncbi:hypothetical protein E2C01_040322 [Portunus trituberculatus]|uniref:Uncharacterized protein n=1 Tax=Portunus trituberculatus TaxID=210409 RepID=A0A5B7FH85_PORTR|nr:hypothetical protein [Portunus trituberculatus]
MERAVQPGDINGALPKGDFKAGLGVAIFNFNGFINTIVLEDLMHSCLDGIFSFVGVNQQQNTKSNLSNQQYYDDECIL